MADPSSDAGSDVVNQDNITKMEVDPEVDKPADPARSNETVKVDPNAAPSDGGAGEENSQTNESTYESSESKVKGKQNSTDVKSKSGDAEINDKKHNDETSEQGGSSDNSGENLSEKRKTEEVETEEGGVAKKPKKESSSGELSPLERAEAAAERAKIHLLPELDPADPPPTGTGLPRHQHKYALSAIRAIKRLKDAAPFVAPVDPVKQGVPHYFDYIKHPMDLGTIEKKLVDNKYDTVHEIVDDFNLVVSNCIIFNGETAVISKMALSIAQSFKKQLSNMPTFDASRKGSQAAAAQAAAQAQAHASGQPGSPAPAAGAASSLEGGEVVIEEGSPDPTVPKRASTTTTVLGPNGVPTLRRKSTIDGRPKREVRPPRHATSSYVGSGTGEGRPRNKKFAAELRFSGQVLREMQSRKLEAISWPFLAPVDPIEQGVPTYFDVIKEPMDLSTISKKLAEGIYYNADEFESDMRLMFRNCYTFNPPGTPVNVLGHKLEDHFNQRWLDKPVPGVHNEDSDMSDVDEEYAESGMVNPAIDVLEEQLRLIRKQLKRLKKDALADFYRRGHRKTGGSGQSSAQQKRRRSSNADHESGHGHSGSGSGSHKPLPTEMTYEMKRELRDKIDKLPEKKINTVIAIIQESMPDLGNNGQDEIELEVDALDTQTLLRLYSYAVLGRREPAKLAASNANGVNGHGSHAGSPGYSADLDANTGKRRSKALSEEEHERKIAEIESKLKEFDHAAGSSQSPVGAVGGGAGKTSPVPGAGVTASGLAAGSAGPNIGDSDSSEDEDRQFDSDSSSEEE